MNIFSTIHKIVTYRRNKCMNHLKHKTLNCSFLMQQYFLTRRYFMSEKDASVKNMVIFNQAHTLCDQLCPLT